MTFMELAASVFVYLWVFLFGVFTGNFLNIYIYHKISARYPFVKLLNGLFYVGAAARGWSMESFLMGICASALLVIGVIDQKSYEIPPVCCWLIGISGVFRLLFDFQNVWDYVSGMCMAGGIFLMFYYLTRGKGIGGGDVKLAAAAGLFMGGQRILPAMLAGLAAGAAIHPVLMKLKGKGRVLALGPYLSFGILAFLFLA